MIGREHDVIDLERQVGRRGGPGQPVRQAVELRHLNPVVVEERADVRVGHALATRLHHVGQPERHSGVPGGLRGLGPLGQ